MQLLNEDALDLVAMAVVVLQVAIARELIVLGLQSSTEVLAFGESLVDTVSDIIEGAATIVMAALSR